MKRRARLLVLGVGMALAATGCVTAERGSAMTPGNRTVFVAAIEPKGTTTVEKEPFPETALPAGAGYVLREPDADGSWTVSSYRWEPSQITLIEGDEVTLEILGINGASHPTTIEGYDLAFDVKRGEVSSVEFVADKPGIHRMVCGIHGPSMVAHLVVLPGA